MEDPKQAFVEYASSYTDEVGGDDEEVMFIEIIRKNDDSREEGPEEEGSTTTKGDIVTEFCSPSWWKELSKETSSKTLPCGDGSCWKTRNFVEGASILHQPDGVGSKRCHVVPYGELDDILDADNRPPMLEKDMYDSWKSIMELYMMNRQHERMILESVQNGSLIWPTIEENSVTRPRKYTKLTPTKAIQADCDVKATNIILQGLPPEVYTLLHAYLGQHEFHANEVRLMHERNSDPLAMVATYQMTNSGLTVPLFKKGDNPIDSINRMMSFLSVVVTSRYPTTNNRLRNSSNPRQQATINDERVTLQLVQGRQISFATGTTRTYTLGASGSNFRKQRTVICYNSKGEGHMSKQCTKPKRKRDDSWFKDKVLLVQAQANGQIIHEEELAFLADPGIIEANLAHYGSDALAEKKPQQLEPKLYDGDDI
nr:hypothetical protein [Tanacetum cinerariifolium]